MKTRFGKSAACVLATLLLLSSVPSMGRGVVAAEDLPGNPEIETKDQARGANASCGLSGASSVEDTWGDCPVTFDEDTGLLTVGAGTLSRVFPASISKSSVIIIEFAEGVKAPAYSIQLFDFMNNLEEIRGELDTSNVTDMYKMFSYCDSLSTLDVSGWDTSLVTDMGSMFYGCSSLTALDVSDWDTGSVLFLGYMFYGCSSLTALDVSSWDTGSVLDMTNVFYNCESLSTLDVSSWDTSRVGSMRSMFYRCNSLTSLDVSLWDTRIVEDMSALFNGCSSLSALDVSSWETGSATRMNSLFGGCRSLSTLDVSSWDTSSVKNMGSMFAGCSSLSTLDVSSWDTSGVENMGSLFENCGNFATLDLSRWDTSYVENMKEMFRDCTSLSTLDVSDWDTGHVTNMERMFNYCDSLSSLDVSSWDTGSLVYMGWMFDGCTSLTALDVSDWNTSSVTDMGNMFAGCENLTSLDVSNWDTGSVTNISWIFSGCENLTPLDVSSWDTGSCIYMRGMFDDCKNLDSLDVSGWDISSAMYLYTMFGGCSGLTALDLSRWDTSNVTEIRSMFSGCDNLTSLDVSGWDTSSVTDMRWMFTGAGSLRYLTLGTKSIFDGGPGLPLINTSSGYYTGRWIRVAPEDPIIAYDNSTKFMLEYDGTYPGTYTRETDPNASYIVAFEVDGGSEVPSQQIGHGGLVTKPDDPTKDGHLFSGWYLDEAHKVLYDFTTPVTDSLTLYAKWAINHPDFPDVPSNKWHYPYIKTMANLGIVSGWGTTGQFRPDYNVIREHAAKMICLSADLPLGGTDTSFEDHAAINPSMIPYIRALMTKGAIGGFPGNTFQPKDNIKRSHACKMVAQAFDLQAGDLVVHLNDLPASQGLRDAILTLASNGIVSGYGTTGEFRPNNEISRAELSKVLCVTMAVSAVQRAEREGTWEAIQAAQAILDALPYHHIPETIDGLQARLDAIALNG